MRFGATMTFDQAVTLARLIKATPGWYVLAIEAASGEKLEDDLWGVQAISTLNWRTPQYWNRPEIIEQWSQFVEGWEYGQKNKRDGA